MNAATARNRIAEFSHLNAFISLTEEDGEGPVVAVKDVIDVKGMITTAGGTILPKTPAAEDAPVIRALRSHGCIVIGKTNLHEFAFGVTNENPHFGPCLNPRDPTRVPGGSSGGSAAAVAAGMCDWAIGTDTGGSVRIPASLCGVVGVKPTRGFISNEGVVPLAWSLDTLGPLAPDVRTAAQALEWMSGRTGLVPESPSLKEFRIGVPEGWADGLDEQTQTCWDSVTAQMPVIAFPGLDYLTNLFQPVFFVEAAAYHRHWLQETPGSYGSDVLDSLQRGMKVPGVYYVEAIRCRSQAIAAVEEAMRGFDAVLVPTTAIVAPKLNAEHVREPLLRFGRPFSLTEQPVVTLPGPVTGLPVGIQVVGHRNEDAALLAVAAALEANWAERRDFLA